ncbi:MAG: hypothetical protein ACNYNY_03475 [Candidatus Oxydemutatoraceae bacterium WSBS_2016_MAG_OTU14]
MMLSIYQPQAQILPASFKLKRVQIHRQGYSNIAKDYYTAELLAYEINTGQTSSYTLF